MIESLRELEIIIFIKRLLTFIIYLLLRHLVRNHK